MRLAQLKPKLLLPALALAFAAGALAVPEARGQDLVIGGEKIADAALLAAARKEGKMTLYGTWTPDNQKTLSDAFKKDTGVDVSFIRLTSGKMYQRVVAEHAAGSLGADFIDLTDLTFVVDLVEKGVLTVPHRSPGFDKIPANLKDPQGRWYTFMLLIQIIGINTALVKPGDEPKGYKDLLDPKWKGKIGMPTIDAGGSAFAAQAFIREVVDKDFWPKLKAQEPRIYPSVAPTVTDMVRGEVSVAFSGHSTVLNQSKKGAPAKVIFPAEGLPSFPLTGGVAVSAKNPNAAKLYLNYVTSKRGGTVIAGTGNYGTNADAPIPSEPGLTYPPQSKLWSLDAAHWIKVRDSYSEEWRAIFGAK